MRLIQDGMLDKSACDTLINLYQDNRPLTKLWHSTNTLNLAQVEDQHDQLAKKIIFGMTTFLSTKGAVAFPELCQVVHRPEGTSHGLHMDDARTSTVMTSITYLNDDYEGGETFFEDGLTVAPKLGRSLFFDGRAFRHGVNEIKGNRFTLAIWYASDINDFYGIS
jgi:hypothetical protein